MVQLRATDMIRAVQTLVSRRGGSVFGSKTHVGAKCCQRQNALTKMVCNLLTSQGKHLCNLNNRVGMGCRGE